MAFYYIPWRLNKHDNQCNSTTEHCTYCINAAISLKCVIFNQFCFIFVHFDSVMAFNISYNVISWLFATEDVKPQHAYDKKYMQKWDKAKRHYQMYIQKWLNSQHRYTTGTIYLKHPVLTPTIMASRVQQRVVTHTVRTQTSYCYTCCKDLRMT